MARSTKIWWDHLEPITDPESTKTHRIICYREGDSERNSPLYLDLDADDANALRRQLVMGNGDNVVPMRVEQLDDGEK